MIELLHIDCMEYMKTQPDNAFDLAIVDPPFGIGNFVRSTSHGKKIISSYSRDISWNNDIPLGEYFCELERVSRKRIIWGANYYNCFNPGGALIWYKNTGADTLSQCAIASLSFQKKIDYVQINNLAGAVGPERIHPCQMPIKLYAWVLDKYAKPGQRILDTHLGSGSSAIAAYYFGVDFVGCEIDEDYYKAAKERFDNETRQETLAL